MERILSPLSEHAESAQMRTPIRRLLALLAGESLLLLLLGATIEGAARFLLFAGVVPREELRLKGPLVIRPHPYMGFVLREGAVRGEGSETQQSINRQGCRGNPIARKEPGAFRVLCVGDSVTYGDSLAEDQTMPFQLEAEMRRRNPTKKIDVVNAGVLQYTSAESLVSLALRGLDMQPDVVVFHEGANDVGPRLVQPYRADYSHYRAVWFRDTTYAPDAPLERSEGYLVCRWLAGIYPAAQRLDFYTLKPLPKTTQAEKELAFSRSSEDPFIRNETFGVALARARGAHSLIVAPGFSQTIAGEFSFVGAAAQRKRVRQERVAKSQGAAFLDLTRALDDKVDFRDVVHLTQRGAKVVASRIADEIENQGWMPK